MRRFLLAIALATGLAAQARAQTPGCVPNQQCVVVQQFVPSSAGPSLLTASVVSAAIPLPAQGNSFAALVFNAGPAQAWVVLGLSNVVATTVTGTAIPAGQSALIPAGTNTTIAAVTQANTAALSVTSGTGAPALLAGPLQIGPALTLSYSLSGALSVGTTSGQLVAAGALGRTLQVCTLPASTTNVWLNPAGGAAVVGQGVRVPAGGTGCPTFGTGNLPMPTGQINAITDSGSAQNVTLVGG
jgi:hypothetical protein